MHELACPNCNSTAQYDLRDFMLLCPFCSCSFKLDMESGQKDIFGDHYIVSNSSDPGQIKAIILEWLRRMHHRPGAVEKEYFIVDIAGYSVPFWVVSLEGHTAWKGMIKRAQRSRLDQGLKGDYFIENGQFRRTYRWAISARKNIGEVWGMTRLHEPKEEIGVEWDGFPLDSTFSRGRLAENPAIGDRTAYDLREYFDFKLSNNLPVLGVEISEEEGLRRTKNHVLQYHFGLAKLNVDILVDHRTEIEIAGMQLIHLPFWHASYVYKPKTALKHFYRQKEKNVIIEGFSNGVLKGEIALQHSDKHWVNSVVCGAAAIVLFVLGLTSHPAFFLVAAFTLAVGLVSSYMAISRREKSEEELLLESPGGGAATEARSGNS